MEKRNIKLKKTLFIVAIFLILAVLIISKEAVRFYRDRTLIKKCIEVTESRDYESMIVYLPQALKIPNFIFLTERHELFLAYDKEIYSSENTYARMQVEYLFAYIHLERYDEFHEEFPKYIYKLLKSDHSLYPWMESLRSLETTKTGFENIIKALDENKPLLPEITYENYWEVTDYVLCLVYKSGVYSIMGEDAASEDCEKEIKIIYHEMDKDIMKMWGITSD